MKFLVSYQYWHKDYSSLVSGNQSFDYLDEAISYVFENLNNWRNGFSIFSFLPNKSIEVMTEIFYSKELTQSV